MGRERWRLPDGREAPDDMVFRVEPPAQIGEVIGAWTNVGPDGPPKAPLGDRLGPVWNGAAIGFGVGLVGTFVVGGISGETGPDAANAFVMALVVGTLGGAAIGAPFAMRAPRGLTLFVGREGCAQISGTDVDVLLYRDLASFREHVHVVRHMGVRTAFREIHARTKDGKERPWYVTLPPGEQPKDDPAFAFYDAVRRAHAAHEAG